MRRFQLILVAALLVLTGCASNMPNLNAPGADAECETGNAERDKACYRESAKRARELIVNNARNSQRLRQLEERLAAAEKGESDKPSDKPSGELKAKTMPRPRTPVMGAGTRLVPYTPDGECGHDGYNLGIRNLTNRFIEVRGQTKRGMPVLKACGDDLVTVAVEQGNGKRRLARICPPQGRCAYMFLPWNGGHGYQRITVDAYAATGVSVARHGMSVNGLPPAKYTGTWRYSIPRKTPWRKAWYNVDVRSSMFRSYRN
ncbi:MAG: hypothetical protein ABII13_04455 [Patescibacteria group bacterium]